MTVDLKNLVVLGPVSTTPENLTLVSPVLWVSDGGGINGHVCSSYVPETQRLI